MMAFDEEKRGDAVILRLCGDLLAGASGQKLKERLDRITQESVGPIVLDLTDLKMLDSTALGVVVGCGRTLHGVGRELYLAKPNERVALLLSLTQIGAIFPVVPTVDAALEKPK
jgi:anti-anti-sigma factor